MHRKFRNVPYRAGCNTNQIYHGECFQHRQGSGAFVPEYVNVTRVPDYALGSTAAIPPYPSPTSNFAPNCAEDPDCNEGNPVCDGLTRADVLTCNAVDYNCYQATSDLIDFNTCRKLGFKNIQARKNWHGRYGFTSHEAGGCADGQLGEECNNCNYENAQPNPDTTRYLTIYKSIYAYVVDNDDPCYSWGSFNYQRQYTVHPMNGVISMDFCSDVTGGTYQLAYAGAFSSGPYCGVIPTYVTDAIANRDLGSDIEVDVSISNTAYHWEVRTFGTWGCDGGPMERKLFSKYGVTMTLSNAYTSENLYSNVNELLAAWNLGDDITYPWRIDEFCTVAPLVTRNETGPTSPDIWTPCTVNDLSQPTGADGSYPQIPWTDPNAAYFDGSIVGAPLPQGYRNFYNWTHPTWAACFDYGNSEWAYWIKYYGAWSARSDAGDPTDSVVPFSTTQWTDSYSASLLAPCAWLDYRGGVLTAQKWAEIQIARPSYNFARPCGKDRYNMDEPTVRCVSGFVTGITPSVTIDTFYLGDSTIATNDPVLICGTNDTGIDGGWRVTRLDENNFQLSQRIFSYPSGFVSPHDGRPNGIFGKIRFPSAPAVCGKVRVADASNTAPISLTLTEDVWLYDGDKVQVAEVKGNTAANGYWTVKVKSPSEILLLNTSGNGTYKGAGVITSRFAVDEQWNDSEPKGEFSYLAWNFDYRSVGENTRLRNQYIACTGCTSNPDLIRPNQALWGMPSEISSFTCETHCLPHSNCAPSVMAISPNGEEWSNGITFPFPSFICDDRYGAYWQGAIRQNVTDPLWQTPHKPCVGGTDFEGEDFQHPQHLFWNEDDGTCLADGTYTNPDTLNTLPIKYYPARPLVESRCELPAGSPGLPRGIYFGCLTLGQLDTTTQPEGNVCTPLGSVGLASATALPRTVWTPWGAYLRQLGCVCGGGRSDFVDDYEANGIACTQEVPPP